MRMETSAFSTSDHMDELSHYVELLSDFHKQLRLRMGRKNKSKKWAIWLLQGASLAQSTSILNTAKISHVDTLIADGQRYASELVDLIAYINRKTTPANYAKKWFEGDVWTAPKHNPNKTSRKRAEEEEKNKQAYKDEYKYHWVGSSYLNHALSTPHHPAYKSVRYSFLYSPLYTTESYSLLSDDEAMPTTDHYALRLMVQMSAFALCNGDNVF